jgi:radical SAM superfamily enzyme YgiQ (UPF0313 family)
VNPPYEESVYTEAPLGLAYIAAILEKEFDVKIFDCVAMRWNLDKYGEELKNFSPDIIGITAMTPILSSAAAVAKTTKQILPNAKIVLGGPHITLLAEETMKEISEIDFGVMGEGEYVMQNLAFALRDGKALDFKGIIYRKEGKLVNNGRSDLIQDLDALPFPARHLLPIDRYTKIMGEPKKFVTMMTARGCPYNCIFCAKAMFGRIYRERSVKNVIEEIDQLKKEYGIKEIVFYDDSFTLNKNRIMKLCDEMIKLDYNIKWKCETRVNLVDEKLLKKMKEAGCYVIAYGIESGVQKNLDFLAKGVKLEDIQKGVKMTKDAGIEVEAYLIIGIPGETKEEVEETIRFAKELDVDYVQFSILTPLPDTELYKYAKEHGLIREVNWSKFSYFGDKANVTMKLENFTPEELQALKNRAMKEFYMRPRYVLKRITSIRSWGEFKNLISAAKVLIKWKS